MGIWQKRLGSWASWWNTEIKVNPTQVYEDMGHPVQSLPTFSGEATGAGGRDPGGVADGAGGRRAGAVGPPEGARLRGRHGAAAAAGQCLPGRRKVTDMKNAIERQKLDYAVQVGY